MLRWPEIGLQRPGVVALVGQREATGVPQHVRVNLEAEPGSLASALQHAGKAAVVNGEPRSDVNTNGDFGSCSRCSRRRARISSPMMGCVAGVPFLALRTCRTAWLKSI